MNLRSWRYYWFEHFPGDHHQDTQQTEFVYLASSLNLKTSQIELLRFIADSGVEVRTMWRNFILKYGSGTSRIVCRETWWTNPNTPPTDGSTESNIAELDSLGPEMHVQRIGCSFCNTFFFFWPMST